MQARAHFILSKKNLVLQAFSGLQSVPERAWPLHLVGNKLLIQRYSK